MWSHDKDLPTWDRTIVVKVIHRITFPICMKNSSSYLVIDVNIAVIYFNLHTRQSCNYFHQELPISNAILGILSFSTVGKVNVIPYIQLTHRIGSSCTYKRGKVIGVGSGMNQNEEVIKNTNSPLPEQIGKQAYK
jgi:hypothetical protein